MARSSSRRATTRIALVRADEHRARVASSGRYHAWPSRRSTAGPREADRVPPVLLPPGRIRPQAFSYPSARPWR